MKQKLLKYLVPVDNHISRNKHFYFDGILLFFVFFLIFNSLNFEGIFNPTTPYGGDHAFHVANYQVYREEILSQNKLFGWSSEVYGGTSFPQFYPPFIFWFSELLSLFFHWTVSYKLMVFIGIVLFPISVYLFLILLKQRWPASIIASVLSLLFLFQKDYYAFGGNFVSTFAGEIAHLYSLSFLLLFIGLYYRGLTSKKMTLPIIFFFLTGISHPISLIIIAFVCLWPVIRRDDITKLWYTFRVYLVGSLLSGIWVIQYLSESANLLFFSTNNFKYGWPISNLSSFLPTYAIYLGIFFIFISLILIIWKVKNDGIHFLLFLFSIPLLLFILTILKPIRYIPLITLILIFIVAACLAHFLTKKSDSKVFSLFSKNKGAIVICLLVIVIFFLQATVGLNEEKQGGWLFNGYEHYVGENNDQYRVSEYLEKRVRDSRVLVSGYDVFQLRSYTSKDSARALFTQTPSSLYFEFLYNSLKENTISSKDAYDKLLYANIGWIVSSKTQKSSPLHNHTLFPIISVIGEYEIRVVRNKTDSFSASPGLPLDQYTDKKAFLHANRLLMKSPRIHNVIPVFIGNAKEKTKASLDSYNARYLNNTSSNCFAYSDKSFDKIHITTNCVGEPLLIKYAYNERWVASDGSEILPSYPYFTLVVPNTESFIIEYKRNWSSYAALLSFVAGIILFFLFRRYVREPPRFIVFIWKAFNAILISTDVFCKKLRLRFLYNSRVGYIFVLVVFLLLLNIGFPIMSYLFESAYLDEGIAAFDAGSYNTSLDYLEKVTLREEYVISALKYKGLIYLALNDTKNAQNAIFGYINKGGDETPMLRYSLLTYYYEQAYYDKYLHELDIIESQHSGSNWTQKAFSEYRLHLEENDQLKDILRDS